MKYSIPGNEQHGGSYRNEPVVIHDASNRNNRANTTQIGANGYMRARKGRQMRLSSAQSEQREHADHIHQECSQNRHRDNVRRKRLAAYLNPVIAVDGRDSNQPTRQNGDRRRLEARVHPARNRGRYPAREAHKFGESIQK